MNALQFKGKRYSSTNEKLIEWLLKIGSKENSLVLDLFSGSGTTSRIAKKMDRNFIGIEEGAVYQKGQGAVVDGKIWYVGAGHKRMQEYFFRVGKSSDFQGC